MIHKSHCVYCIESEKMLERSSCCREETASRTSNRISNSSDILSERLDSLVDL